MITVPNTIAPPRLSSDVSRQSTIALERISQIIDQAGELLPIAGPIGAFAFLNPLQAFEDLRFEEGVAKAGRLFGAHPYLAEEKYRDKLARGRIRAEDLAAVLEEDLGDDADTLVGSLGTRHEIRLAMLQFPLRDGPAEELRWFVAETDALTRMRGEVPVASRDRFIEQTCRWLMREAIDGGDPSNRHPRQMLADLIAHFGEDSVEQWSAETWESLALQALWRICRQGVQGIDVETSVPPSPTRHRDLLLEATGEDSDLLVHGLLIRFCAAYADQGLAPWSLPERERGFFQSFCALYGKSGGPPDRWLHGLAGEIERIRAVGHSALESISESLEMLGVPDDRWGEYLTAHMLALRGWASMLRQMVVRGDRVPLPAPAGTMDEYIAVRLILERLAITYVARSEMNYQGSLADLREALLAQLPERTGRTVEQRAFTIFQLAQLLSWTPPLLYQIPKERWAMLVRELEAFRGFERRRVFHRAFERRYRLQALDAIAIHCAAETSRVRTPSFQAAFCIDAREESFRRHLEEVDPNVETFGAAGFFSVAMYYRGVADAHFAALCPIVIMPKHWVVEDVVFSLNDQHLRRQKTRRVLGTATHQVQVGSRGVWGGAIITAGLGVLATVPLVARVLFPRLTARIRKTVGRLVEAPPMTRLRLERSTPEPGSAGDAVGFTLEEMTNIGERVLRDIGLTSNFARLMIFFGHGSFCLNNPHKSAYDCGACSGSAGSPNARALAMMLNDVRVREALAKRDLVIPRETVFLGGLHNTCDDTITFLDLDLLPLSHQKDVESAMRTLRVVCERNAHERCRRFDSAPLSLSLSGAHKHVEGRSEDLAQTRPEFGNASNALCFVGRRQRVRGLYMDRRAFMHSYDPLADNAESAILARILSAVVPVCQGINLQYYFSSVDSPGWACGTKLPHNVTSLLGVMDGTASDLRQGLPWQSVEIHEPMRLLFVMECTPDAMLRIMDGNPTVAKILRNDWAQLAVLDPHSNKLQFFRHEKFEPYAPEATDLPHADSSIDWYRGWRNHLGFASIGG